MSEHICGTIQYMSEDGQVHFTEAERLLDLARTYTDSGFQSDHELAAVFAARASAHAALAAAGARPRKHETSINVHTTAAPAHPEPTRPTYLEGEDAYRDAPVGTVAEGLFAQQKIVKCVGGAWVWGDDGTTAQVPLVASREVLHWGDDPVRLFDAASVYPEGTVLQRAGGEWPKATWAVVGGEVLREQHTTPGGPTFSDAHCVPVAVIAPGAITTGPSWEPGEDVTDAILAGDEIPEGVVVRDRSGHLWRHQDGKRQDFSPVDRRWHKGRLSSAYAPYIVASPEEVEKATRMPEPTKLGAVIVGTTEAGRFVYFRAAISASYPWFSINDHGRSYAELTDVRKATERERETGRVNVEADMRYWIPEFVLVPLGLRKAFSTYEMGH